MDDDKIIKIIGIMDKYHKFVPYLFLVVFIILTFFKIDIYVGVILFIVFIIYIFSFFGYRRYLTIKILKRYSPKGLMERVFFGRTLKKKERKDLLKKANEIFNNDEYNYEEEDED